MAVFFTWLFRLNRNCWASLSCMHICFLYENGLPQHCWSYIQQEALVIPDALFGSIWNEQVVSKMILVLLLFLEKGKSCHIQVTKYYILSFPYDFNGYLYLVAGNHVLTGPNEVKQCEGGSIHIICHYHPFYRDNVKYWCKGYYFNYCTILLRTSQSQHVYEPLQISDDKRGGFFTIHMENVKTADSGWYWCAIERVSRHVSKAMQLIISAGKLTFLCLTRMQ